MHSLPTTILLLTALCHQAYAQQPPAGARNGDRVEIIHADRWDFDERAAPGAQRLVGDVRFKHGQAVMSCDSAYLFENNEVEAFGHVRIRQQDTLNIVGDRLSYNGRDRLATISGDVRLSDPGMELVTDRLVHHLPTRTAHYATGATITDKRAQRTLTSGAGAYVGGARRLEFSRDVRIVDPERTITGDTLHYITNTGEAAFFGPTYIVQGATHMWCERGTFDTATGNGRFIRKGRIVEDGVELRGDTLIHDNGTGEGLAFGHVMLVDTANDLLVRGGRGRHSMRGQDSHVTGKAELLLLLAEDTLFLHADTLFASMDSAGARLVQGRRGVRFFKKDLQGACDTMVHSTAEGMVRLLGSPVVWGRGDQITGDTVAIELRDERPHQLHALGHALLVAPVDTLHFNQVAGRRMKGRFREGELDRLDVVGNARTVYFMEEEQPDSSMKVVGVNRADCSRIVVDLDSIGKVSGVSFITKPDGKLHPLDKAPPDALQLEGFRWLEALRPKDREGIFQRPVMPIAPAPVDQTVAPSTQRVTSGNGLR